MSAGYEGYFRYIHDLYEERKRELRDLTISGERFLPPYSARPREERALLELVEKKPIIQVSLPAPVVPSPKPPSIFSKWFSFHKPQLSSKKPENKSILTPKRPPKLDK